MNESRQSLHPPLNPVDNIYAHEENLGDLELDRAGFDENNCSKVDPVNR